jgi:hypothetical protein
MRTCASLAAVFLIATHAAAQAQSGKDAQARPGVAGLAPIPEVQPGKWKVRFTRDGRTSDEEQCGNPIDGFNKEVREYAANTRWGCTMTSTSTGPRSVLVVYNCPSDRAPDGTPVTKGRTELTVVSPSPQSFRIEMKSTAWGGHVMEGARVGNCP